MTSSPIRVALVVPCYNEALTIGPVIDEFKQVWPSMELYVFDNNSSDGTAEVARAHGAQVTQVRHQGKGNVVRRMFADVEADIYVMVDGDATYDASGLPEHIRLMLGERLDMVLGQRQDAAMEAATNYRLGHRVGNRALTGVVMWLFGGAFNDMLSGYRLFSRRFAKSYAAHAHGFETETELTVHALELRMPCRELPVIYRSRPEGSFSKLSTYRDGWRIARTIIKLLATERPLAFFSVIGALLALISLLITVPVFITYGHTGLVPRIPTTVLAVGLMLSALLSFASGILMQQITLARREAKHLAYLRVPAPGQEP